MKVQILSLGLVFLMLFSCSEQEQDISRIAVNHYRQTAVGLDRTLVYLIQENEKRGSSQWDYYYENIEGFQYEPGFIYDLEVQKKQILNPPADGSSFKYLLNRIISKEKVTQDTTFDVMLKSVERSDPPEFVTGDPSDYKLLDEIVIDCGNLCDNLKNLLETEDEVWGVFEHGEAGVIKLKELKIL